MRRSCGLLVKAQATARVNVPTAPLHHGNAVFFSFGQLDVVSLPIVPSLFGILASLTQPSVLACRQRASRASVCVCAFSSDMSSWVSGPSRTWTRHARSWHRGAMCHAQSTAASTSSCHR